jgi:hypothetical protein
MWMNSPPACAARGKASPKVPRIQASTTSTAVSQWIVFAIAPMMPFRLRNSVERYVSLAAFPRFR